MHETLPGIQQHAIWFAGPFVPRDFTAKGIRRVLIDVGNLKGCTIDHGRVSVGARENQRIVWRNAVEILPRGKYRRFPVRFHPPPPRKPPPRPFPVPPPPFPFLQKPKVYISKAP